MSVLSYLSPLLPEFVLLIGACVVLFAGVMTSLRQTSAVSVLAMLTILGALAATLFAGETASDTSIPGLWFTSLTYYARFITLSVGALLLLLNWDQPVAEERGEFLSMILFSLLGVLLTASANDWLVLFFAIELVSVPTYVMISLSRLDSRAAEAGVKYFFLGALSAAVLAYGLTFLYGVTGTTTIHRAVGGSMVSTIGAGGALGGLGLIGLLLVLSGLAFKIAAVPFHVYAPDVYEGAASPVTAFLGFVPKFAGFLAIIKLMTALSWDLGERVVWVLWLLAAVTMTAGNVLALLQKNIKRMLAYSSIAHTGYMLVAVLVGPVAAKGPLGDGVAAVLFYIGIYGTMNLGAFALLGSLKIDGRDVETLQDLAGAAARVPVLAFLFAVCLFSLMGFPPTAGLIGKWYVFGSAFSVADKHPMQMPFLVLGVIGVVNSAIAAAYYLRAASACYVGEANAKIERVGSGGATLGLLVSAVAMLVLFARPAILAEPAKRATSVVHQQMGMNSTRVTTAVDPITE